MCDDCKARQRAKPTTDRELRIMKESRRRLWATRKARGLCVYCEAPNTTPYLGCLECLNYRAGYCAARRSRIQSDAESAESANLVVDSAGSPR